MMLSPPRPAVEKGLIRAWFWLHLVVTLAIAAQPTSPAVILGRYSVKAAVLLLAFLLTAPLVWVVTNRLRLQIDRTALSRRAHAALFLGCIALLFVGWAIHLGPTGSYVVLRLYASTIIVTIAIWDLRHLTVPGWANRLPPLLGLLTLALLFLLAPQYPGIKWTDEGFVASAAWSLATSGQSTVGIYYPVEHQTFSLMFSGLARWFEAFGVSLASARLFTLTLTTLSLLIAFPATRRLYGRSAAWGATILGACSLLALNFVYQDVEVPLWLALSYSLFIAATVWKREQFHFLVGLTVALSVDGHPVAYRYGVTFAAAYLLEWALALRARGKWFVFRPFVYLVLGGLGGLALYLGYYRLTNPRFEEISSQSPFFLHGLGYTFQLLREQLNTALQDAPLLFGFALAGVAAALKRNSPLDRLLLLSLFGAAILLAALYERNRQYYLLHSIVPLTLLAAGGLAMLSERVERSERTPVMVGMVCLIAAASMGLLYDKYRYRLAQGYDSALLAADAIREVVPRDSDFVGIDPFFFEMWDYPHFMDVTVAQHWRKQQATEMSEVEAWTALAPDAVAVVHDYPLPEHVAALIEYVSSQPDLRHLRCWEVERLGQVDLYMRGDPTENEPPISCSPLPDP